MIIALVGGVLDVPEEGETKVWRIPYAKRLDPVFGAKWRNWRVDGTAQHRHDSGTGDQCEANAAHHLLHRYFFPLDQL